MKPEEQRIKIAEACGLRVEIAPAGGYYVVIHRTTNDPTGYIKGAHHIFETGAINELPNYLNDLNAMNEAEKVLDDRDDLFDIYRAELYKIMPKEFSLPDRKRWNGCATPAQRAEAFLRTLNLWKP